VFMFMEKQHHLSFNLSHRDEVVRVINNNVSFFFGNDQYYAKLQCKLCMFLCV